MAASIKNLMLGAASALDLLATLDLNKKNTKKIAPEEADYLALLSDWETVGNDIRYAMGQAANGE